MIDRGSVTANLLYLYFGGPKSESQPRLRPYCLGFYFTFFTLLKSFPFSLARLGHDRSFQILSTSSVTKHSAANHNIFSDADSFIKAKGNELENSPSGQNTGWGPLKTMCWRKGLEIVGGH